MRSCMRSIQVRSCSTRPARISRFGSSVASEPKSTLGTFLLERSWRWRRSGSACVRTRWAPCGVGRDTTGGAAPSVLLARHGETDDNRDPIRFQGWRDTPLNDAGRRQAEELAERVSGEGIVSLWSSDLIRASETAEIVGARLGLGVRLDPRLREANRGRWEGRLFRDVAHDEPQL